MVDMANENKKIHWGRECARAFSILFRAVKATLSALLYIFATLGIIAVLCGIICGTAFAVYLSGYVDSSIDQFEMLASDQKQSSQIFVDDADDTGDMGNQTLYSSENRVWVNYDQIPQNLVNAYISIEDKRFYDHNGVDWLRTIRATALYAIGKSDSGGSTLTQQLIKNVTGKDDNTPQRKIEEIFTALNLEKTCSKEQILEMYLNTIYLSQGCNGVQAASYTYFGKPVSQLSLLECAAIASITQNPSKWDPKMHPENNIIRRNVILDNMLDQGKITKAEYDEAYNKELVLYSPQDATDPDDDNPHQGASSDTTSWYVDVVIEDTIALLMEHYNVTYSVAEQMMYTSGFRIVTAMNKDVQSTLEAIYADNALIDQIVGANPGMVKPESAIVVVDPNNGNILGLVGGRGEKYKSRVFNFATQAKRQSGSSLKPLSIYGPALEAGVINYSTVFDDSPYEYNDDGTMWPKNSPAGYKGLTPLVDAVTRSVNTIAIKLVDRLGLQASYKFLTEKLHFTTLYNNEEVNGVIRNDVTLSALGLGGMTYGVTLREMVGGYTMFTNDGVYCQPRTVLRIYDSSGELIIDNELKTEVAMTKENASIMTKIMNNVVVNGTGSSLKLKDNVFTAGKTGTTSKKNDTWFMGFTPYYLGGVWFGYEKPQVLSAFSGNPALKIWDYCMTELHKKFVFAEKEDGSPNYKLDKNGEAVPKIYSDVIDPGVLTLNFCRDCGLLATDLCKSDSRGSRVMVGYFTVDNMPDGYCNCHRMIRYCSGGGIATEYCPLSSCSDKLIVVSELARHRYDDGVYAYRSDEKYVFYDQGDGTYGGIVKTYSEFCTRHNPPAIPVSVLNANTAGSLFSTRLSGIIGEDLVLAVPPEKEWTVSKSE